MRRRALCESARQHDVLTLAATTWLACGVVLFGLTPLPWRDATLGWSPVFWLLAAPCLLLVARRAFPPRTEETPRRPVRSIQGSAARVIRHRKTGTRQSGRARRAA